MVGRLGSFCGSYKKPQICRMELGDPPIFQVESTPPSVLPPPKKTHQTASCKASHFQGFRQEELFGRLSQVLRNLAVTDMSAGEARPLHLHLLWLSCQCLGPAGPNVHRFHTLRVVFYFFSIMIHEVSVKPGYRELIDEIPYPFKK